MKTIIEWVSELPMNLSRPAIAQCNNPYVEVDTMLDAVYGFAVWSDTKEGIEFWDDAAWLVQEIEKAEKEVEITDGEIKRSGHNSCESCDGCDC